MVRLNVIPTPSGSSSMHRPWGCLVGWPLQASATIFAPRVLQPVMLPSGWSRKGQGRPPPPHPLVGGTCKVSPRSMMVSEQQRRSFGPGKMLFLLSCTLVVGVRIGAEAWISEDALITFRTIDNFLQGYGLRWNIDERVQVATHPLWMLVNAALYSLTKEAYTTLVMLSLFLSMAAFWL